MRHKYSFKETEFNSKKDQFRGGGNQIGRNVPKLSRKNKGATEKTPTNRQKKAQNRPVD